MMKFTWRLTNNATGKTTEGEVKAKAVKTCIRRAQRDAGVDVIDTQILRRSWLSKRFVFYPLYAKKEKPAWILYVNRQQD